MYMCLTTFIRMYRNLLQIIARQTYELILARKYKLIKNSRVKRNKMYCHFIVIYINGCYVENIGLSLDFFVVVNVYIFNFMSFDSKAG